MESQAYCDVAPWNSFSRLHSRCPPQVAVREAARALAAAVRAEMGGAGGALAVAKAVPLVSNAADALLAPGARRSALLAAIAALPATERLCATVYSCGPPL